MSKKLLLIDGHSLFHRAYHALPPLTSSSGQPTNAVYGFLQMILGLLEDEHPEYAAVAVDLPGPTFRHEIYEEYTAHRPPMEDDLASQVPLLGEAIEALGLKQAGEPGYEADDVIGTLAQHAVEQGMDVTIVTGDRDLLQLVRPGIEVVATLRGIKDTRRYDEAVVREETGLTPAQLVDLKALAGDSSDNIPGVSGIGDKSAKTILDQFPSVEEALAAVDEIEPARVANRLREGAAEALLSKQLATIETDAPVSIDVADCRWSGLNAEALRTLAGRLEFSSILGRLPADASADQPRTERLRSAGRIQALAAAAQDEGAMCLALAASDNGALALAVAEPGGHVGLVPLAEGKAETTLFDDAGDEQLSLPDSLAAALAARDVAKRGADLKLVVRRLGEAGITVAGSEFDAEIASYLLQPNRRDHSVDLVALEHLGLTLPDGQSSTDEDLTPAESRAAAVASAVRALHEPMREQLRAADVERVFDEIEMPLVEVLADMEQAGIALDTAQLAKIGEDLSEMLAGLAAEIYELAGGEFNIGSPKQLGEVLFDRLQLPRGRRTKTGWSTGADVLDDLADEHEIVSKVLQWREYSKLNSTYVEGLAREVNPKTGRIHTTFEQTVAATGRLSSRNPNLQNIPVRTEWGRRIRGCFVAGSGDTLLVAADYSQIELRILAHMSGDPRLLDAFNEGEDIHMSTASAIFDVPPEQVTGEMRSRAKTVNFAVLYGQGPVALARQLGIERKEAEQFIANYFDRLGGVRRYIDQMVQTAREQLFVSTLLGRKRPIPDIGSSDSRAASYAERTAVNTPIQGTAADIIKLAMIRLAPALSESHPGAGMLLQVHDELVLEAPRERAAAVGGLVKEVMESAYKLDVPLTVDVKAGSNWCDMEALDMA